MQHSIQLVQSRNSHNIHSFIQIPFCVCWVNICCNFCCENNSYLDWIWVTKISDLQTNCIFAIEIMLSNTNTNTFVLYYNFGSISLLIFFFFKLINYLPSNIKYWIKVWILQALKLMHSKWFSVQRKKNKDSIHRLDDVGDDYDE